MVNFYQFLSDGLKEDAAMVTMVELISSPHISQRMLSHVEDHPKSAGNAGSLVGPYLRGLHVHVCHA